MADFVNVAISVIVTVGLLFMALWATTARRQDDRIKQLEADQRFLDAARLALLEKRVAVDSWAFAEQARIHHRTLRSHDERIIYLGRDISRLEGQRHDARRELALADTMAAVPVDRDRPTVRPAR